MRDGHYQREAIDDRGERYAVEIDRGGFMIASGGLEVDFDVVNKVFGAVATAAVAKTETNRGSAVLFLGVTAWGALLAETELAIESAQRGVDRCPRTAVQE